jgi:hypothetical protein
MRRDWVHDYETIKNCFVAVFIDARSDLRKIYVIHELRNDFQEFINFLNHNVLTKEWHISFNGLSFDSQISEFFLRNQERLSFATGEEIADEVYQLAQEIINRQDRGEFLDYSPRDLQIRQVDVFKLNHWDNLSKKSSLKWIQYSMDWYNIQDMPIPHGQNITSLKQIDEIISYCINDVESTKAIMQLSKKQISLRNKLSKDYNIDLYSASEPRIAKELFLHFLSKELNTSKYELKQLKTYRKEILVKDILLDYLDFKTATFQKLKSKFLNLVIDPENTKNAFKYHVRYKGCDTYFGLGGIHGAADKNVYSSTKDMIIMSSDVKSYYPNLAIRNKWYPAHLSKDVFCQQYEWFYDERVKIPKSDPRNFVYKLILNSSFGLSIDNTSFLYDPLFGFKITINGQLSLCLLYEMIMERIPNCTPLMQNTDGLETLIPREYENEYYQICKEWEEITQLELEHETYSKLFLRDVNNYIAVTTAKEVSKEKYETIKKEFPHYVFKENNGKYYYKASKCKGAFEFLDIPLHKNKSYSIIPAAIYYYFIHGIEPEIYLKNNTNIFDFCAGKKIKGNWYYAALKVDKEGLKKEELQKTIRYYISNQGCKLMKYNFSDGREQQVEAGNWLQTLFIKSIDKPFPEYDINYKYYLNKINKEIDKLYPKFKQEKLF